MSHVSGEMDTTDMKTCNVCGFIGSRKNFGRHSKKHQKMQPEQLGLGRWLCLDLVFLTIQNDQRFNSATGTERALVNSPLRHAARYEVFVPVQQDRRFSARQRRPFRSNREQFKLYDACSNAMIVTMYPA
jgi:hypothetical protein